MPSFSAEQAAQGTERKLGRRDRRALARALDDTSAQAALARITMTLAEHRATGSEYVLIDQVLDLVNPRGNWRTGFRPPAPAGHADQIHSVDPAADPLTGCLPVTAPGAGQ